MKILKGYMFRLYPTNKQKELINKLFETYRFIYNYFLKEVYIMRVVKNVISVDIEIRKLKI